MTYLWFSGSLYSLYHCTKTSLGKVYIASSIEQTYNHLYHLLWKVSHIFHVWFWHPWLWMKVTIKCSYYTNIVTLRGLPSMYYDGNGHKLLVKEGSNYVAAKYHWQSVNETYSRWQIDIESWKFSDTQAWNFSLHDHQDVYITGLSIAHCEHGGFVWSQMETEPRHRTSLLSRKQWFGFIIIVHDTGSFHAPPTCAANICAH